MTDPSSLDILKEALLEFQILELEQILAKYPEDIPVSPKHQKAMERILKGKLHTVRNRVIAILVAASLMLLVGCTAYVKRREIADFIEEIFGDHSKVMIFGSSSMEVNGIEHIYTLTYVPEGYELVSTTQNTLFNIQSWEKGAEHIRFDQQLINTQFFYDIEHSEDYRIILLGTLEFYYRQAGGVYQYLWTDNNYVFRIEFSEEFSEEIFLQIIEGVDIQS